MTETLSSERSFEEAIERLEEIVARLEEGAITLEESLQLFEEGVGLARYCQSKLQAAQGRLEIVLRQDQNGVVTAPFLGPEDESI